jgi:hypothetical protein
MLVRRVVAFALLCTALAPSVGCQRCGRLFCRSGIDIVLAPPLADGHFATGAYRMTWVSDDAMDACEFEVTDDDRCPEAPSTCVLDSMSCADPSDFSGEIHMFFAETPESLQITVERDGTVLSDTEHDPAYEESEPVNKGCPTCREATVEIPLS